MSNFVLILHICGCKTVFDPETPQTKAIVAAVSGNAQANAAAVPAGSSNVSGTSSLSGVNNSTSNYDLTKARDVLFSETACPHHHASPTASKTYRGESQHWVEDVEARVEASNQLEHFSQLLARHEQTDSRDTTPVRSMKRWVQYADEFYNIGRLAYFTHSIDLARVWESSIPGAADDLLPVQDQNIPNEEGQGPVDNAHPAPDGNEEEQAAGDSTRRVPEGNVADAEDDDVVLVSSRPTVEDAALDEDRDEDIEYGFFGIPPRPDDSPPKWSPEPDQFIQLFQELTTPPGQNPLSPGQNLLSGSEPDTPNEPETEEAFQTRISAQVSRKIARERGISRDAPKKRRRLE